MSSNDIILLILLMFLRVAKSKCELSYISHKQYNKHRYCDIFSAIEKTRTQNSGQWWLSKKNNC